MPKKKLKVVDEEAFPILFYGYEFEVNVMEIDEEDRFYLYGDESAEDPNKEIVGLVAVDTFDIEKAIKVSGLKLVKNYGEFEQYEKELEICNMKQ